MEGKVKAIGRLATLACIAALSAAPESQAGSPPPNSVEGREPLQPALEVRLLFPPDNFDGQCSYDRPIRRGESLAAYFSSGAVTGGQVTDLDCLLQGQPEDEPATGAGAGSAYAYANAFLLVRRMNFPLSVTLDQILERTRLDQHKPTGEILYFLSTIAFTDGQIDCARALGVGAFNHGIWSGAELVRQYERQRPHGVPSGECRDDGILNLLEEPR